jgi:hypothetical protein
LQKWNSAALLWGGLGMAETNKPEWMAPFVAKINEKIPNSATCRVCGQPKLIPHAEMVTPSTVNGRNIDLGSIVPMAMLICQNCGNTTFHNLILMGVLDEEGNVKS